MRLAAVVIDGPFENERPNAQWTVTKLDEHGNDVGDPQRFDQHGSALSFGRALATMLNLEFIDESNTGVNHLPSGSHKRSCGARLVRIFPRSLRGSDGMADPTLE